MLELASNPGLEFVQQVVSGIAAGGVYASVALALVLIYRAMDVANFAQGEMAMFSTFIAYTLITVFHLPFLVVFPVTIVIAFAGGVLIERVMIRPFEGKPILTRVIVPPALFTRARHGGHSTVRDQPSNVRGASLANGLAVPRSNRAPFRRQASKSKCASLILDTRSACDEAIHAARAMDRHAAQERLAMTE